MRSASVLAAALALMAGGCASTPEVRSLATQTRSYTQSYVQASGEMVARQRQMIELGRGRLDVLNAQTEAYRAETGVTRRAWQVGSDRRLAAHDALASVSAADIDAALDAAPARRAADTAGALSVAKPLRALAEIAAPPDPMAQLEELIGFAGDVQAEVNRLNEEAAKAAAAASAADSGADNAPAAAEGG